MTAHRVSLLTVLLLLAGCVEPPASQPEPPAPSPPPVQPPQPQPAVDPQLADAINRLMDATERQEREIAELRERLSKAVAAPVLAGPPEKARRCILFTADWCGPCQPLKARLVPALRAAGWQVGDTHDCDMQIVDIDKTANRGLVERFDVQSLPMIVITREDRQYVRLLNPHAETPVSLDADRKRFWQ